MRGTVLGGRYGWRVREIQRRLDDLLLDLDYWPGHRHSAVDAVGGPVAAEFQVERLEQGLLNGSAK